MRELKIGERVTLECVAFDNITANCLHCWFYGKCKHECSPGKREDRVIYREVEK